MHGILPQQHQGFVPAGGPDDLSGGQHLGKGPLNQVLLIITVFNNKNQKSSFTLIHWIGK